MGAMIACPTCSNENIQRVAIAHAQSTSVVYDHRNRAVGVQQTGTGVALAPPRPRRMWWRWLITGYFAVDVVASIPISIVHPLVFLGLIIVAALAFLGYKFLVVPGQKYNQTVYAEQKAQWDRAWVCTKCGNVFEV